MGTEQQDLSLRDDEAENVVGGKQRATKTAKNTKTTKSHPGYVPGDTGVVNPSSSGMAGDASTGDDDC
jgi:hypothetical protein